jgi:hypothetical protein
MNLNLGCGNRRKQNFINVDKYLTDATDLTFDLETFPWPWDDNSTDEIHLIHCLEHLGANPEVYLKIIQECYRICKNDSIIRIEVPHPRSDDFLGDPTHVRAITPQSLTLFDKQLNLKWKAEGVSAATPLALYLRVDFYIVDQKILLTPKYHTALNAGQMTLDQISIKASELNNVISEFHITLKARK